MVEEQLGQRRLADNAMKTQDRGVGGNLLPQSPAQKAEPATTGSCQLPGSKGREAKELGLREKLILALVPKHSS